MLAGRARPQTIVYLSTLLLAVQAVDKGEKAAAEADPKSKGVAGAAIESRTDSDFDVEENSPEKRDAVETQHDTHEEKVVTIVRKVPVPIPVTKHVPYPVEKIVPVPIKVDVIQPYPVYRTVPYPVKEIVRVSKIPDTNY